MNILQNSLEKIAEKQSGDFTYSEGTWFNGNGYLPLYNYTIKIKSEAVSIEVRYEHKANEFSKATGLDIGAHVDRHTCSITSRLENASQLHGFIIRHKSRLDNLFSSGLFRVKCKNARVKNVLFLDKDLKELFLLSRESANFKPYISGVQKGTDFIIEVHFAGKTLMPEILDQFIYWLRGMNEKYPKQIL